MSKITMERRKEILHLLKAEGQMSVEDLARSVFVSVPTIRRDLAVLTEKGSVKRTHGMVSYAQPDLNIWPFDTKAKRQLKEKQLIGRLAAGLLKDKDSIFLGSGSTCYYMAKEINSDKRLTILSNSLPVFDLLGKNRRIFLECPCGRYDAGLASILGAETIRHIEKRNARYYFLSCDGIDTDKGITSNSPEDLSVKQAFQRQADQTILLMDHSKISQVKYYFSFHLHDIDVLISDRPLPDQLQEKCSDYGIRVITGPE